MIQELEAKFYVRDLLVFPQKLTLAGAQLVHPRILETNLRFDTPDGHLNQQHQLLRLRKSHTISLTYKGAAQVLGGASQRQEIETEVGDFETTRAMLEALGYQVSRIYEKYRTEYRYNHVLIMLDELPFGHFVEIEGPEVGQIKQMAAQLGLDWSANVTDNYLMLLERVREFMDLAFRDLTFENFNNLSITHQDLGVTPAD